MNIYRAEASVDGLAEKVFANRCTAYHTLVEAWNGEAIEKVCANVLDDIFKRTFNIARASANDNDLKYLKSILVSTIWNYNDDIFGKSQTWAARHTPSHKPTNLEHDEKEIVGHMTDSWAIDGSGSVIADNTVIDDLPNLYHIVNGSVIYNNWEDEKLVERTASLLKAIDAGEMYVSMEALFSDFDYGVLTTAGEFNIVARNEETAFLTKHLRVYGGLGEYDGHKLGRVLNNITFCGKGYVSRPGNKYSVILNDVQSLDFSKAYANNLFRKRNGVFISCSDNLNEPKKDMEQSPMSDDKSLKILQDELAEAKKVIAGLQKDLSETSKASVEAKVTTLETEVATLQQKLVNSEASVTELSTAKSNLEAKVAELSAAKAELDSKLADLEKETIKSNRVSMLVGGGYTNEEALAKVEVFASLADDQFKVVADELVAAKKDKDKEKDKMKDKSADSSADDVTVDPKDATLASGDSDPLDNVDTSTTSDDATLSSDAALDNNDDGVESLRENLSKTLAGRLFKKSN